MVSVLEHQEDHSSWTSELHQRLELQSHSWNIKRATHHGHLRFLEAGAVVSVLEHQEGPSSWTLSFIRGWS